MKLTADLIVAFELPVFLSSRHYPGLHLSPQQDKKLKQTCVCGLTDIDAVRTAKLLPLMSTLTSVFGTTEL